MVTPRLADLLRRAATDEPDREAFLHGDERVTYGRLDRMADGVAATLAGRGVTTGDVVALLLPSSIAFAACYLGAARVGAITTAINLRLGPAEQSSILRRAEPRVVVTGDPARLPERVRPASVLTVEDLDAAFSAPPPEHLPRPDGAGDPVCIVWTGGTTGVPKGAVYDHAALAAIARGQGDVMSAHDRLLHAVPFAHLGFMGWCWGFLARRMTIVLGPEPWSAAATLRLVEAARVTVMNGVPTQWSRLLDHEDVSLTDFSTLRVVAMGGAAAAPELIRRLRETLGCPVLNGYSATEAGVISGTVIGDSDEVVAGTVGRPRSEVDLRIVGPDATDVPVGEVGEVICRSPAMMRGYWHDPDLTATVIDADGYLHTGDLGRLRPDGNLTLAGRLTEMYIRGGYNVYPTEVEAVLTDHPAIARAAVIGAPDPVLGEIGVAFVVLDPGSGTPDAGDVPDRDALRAWCADRIADYKAPDRVVVVDELPVTAVGKLDKNALAARWAESLAAEAATPADPAGGHR